MKHVFRYFFSSVALKLVRRLGNRGEFGGWVLFVLSHIMIGCARIRISLFLLADRGKDSASHTGSACDCVCNIGVL